MRFLKWAFLVLAILSICIVVFVFCIWESLGENLDYRFGKTNNISIWEMDEYKTILAYNIPPWFSVRPDSDLLLQDFKCAVDKCRLTTKHSKREVADLVIFHEHYVQPRYARSPNQIYALFHMESPFHTDTLTYSDVFNWTITYRNDSTIQAPYGKWMYFDLEIRQKEQHRNYAANKMKMVAWFVSNCNDRNGRLKYALELQKYVQVDIYGKCGSLSCSRENTHQCYDMLDRDYKFYLSFENSNCKDYITEKLFENALQRNVLPIVMGASPEDYAKYAPQRSYIHVDEFESPIKLAEYLHELDKNDEMYNSYFQWKGTGEFVGGENYFCQACALLYENQSISTSKWYADFNEWWRGPGICTTGSWRNFDITKSSAKKVECNQFFIPNYMLVIMFYEKYYVS